MTPSTASNTFPTARRPRREAPGRTAPFFSRTRRAAGVTLLELLLTIALVAVLSAMVGPFLANSLNTRSLDIFSSQAVDALREAQFSAVNGRGAASFGVHFEAGQFVFFTGPAYNPADADNQAHIFDDGVSITAITLTGGGADVHFSSHRGIPSESGTVVFSDGGGQTKTVTIGAAGMLDVN